MVDPDLHKASGVRGNVKFAGGIAVGLTLVAVGFLLPNLITGLSDWSSQLILIAGLGIILFAFGSSGTGKFMGWTVTGSAAIVIALLYVSADIRKKHVTKGSISGPTIDQTAEIEVVGAKTFLGAFRDHRFRFIAFADELDELVSVHLTIAGKDLPELIIQKRFIADHTSVDWEWDDAKGELKERATNKRIASIHDRSANVDADAMNLNRKHWSLLPRAYAYEPPKSYDELMKNLDSSSFLLRRQAKSGLAKFGLSYVVPIADTLLDDDISQKRKFGVMASLSEILQNHKQARQDIANQLTSEHIEKIADTVFDSDRNLSVYAAEFLQNLADPRSVPMIFDRASRDALNAEGQYLGVLVLERTFEQTPDLLNDIGVKQSLRQLANHGDPKIKSLIISIIGEASVESLSGRYEGEWWSHDRTAYYGNLTVDLLVLPNGSASATFVAEDSPVKPEGKLKGKLVKDGLDWMTKGFRDGRLKVDAKLDGIQLEGRYDTRFYLFFRDTGSWRLNRVYD